MTIALVSGQLVQSDFSASGTSTTQTLSLPNNPTTGNFVVLGLITRVAKAGTTVVDANGNAYTASTNSPNPNGVGGVNTWIFYLPNAPSNASKNIVLTTATASRFDAWAGEFSGVATSNPLDVDAPSTGTGSVTSVTDPSLTTTANGDLLASICWTLNAVTSINSPWTVASAIMADLNAGEYMIQSTAGAQTVNYTITSGTYNVMAAAFKAATGGGPTYRQLPETGDGAMLSIPFLAGMGWIVDRRRRLMRRRVKP